jgi:diguanylate cyclase
LNTDAPGPLVERDERQALRVRRYLMAAGTSVLVCLTLAAFAFLQILPWRAAVEGSIGVLGLTLAFYALFRSGLNLRFADPSVTAAQVGAALLCLAYIMYHAGAARPLLLIFYLVAMLFGVLRLDGRRLMRLAVLALAAHGTVLALLAQRGGDRAALLTEFVLLAVVLPWFAAMGGYVNRLRMRLSDSHRELRRAFDRIEQLALRDELTGAYNRRFMMECLARERSRMERLGVPFSICLIDIDHFKAINDTLGHAAGDAVLRQLPKLAASSLRAVDVFGRVGGEEFLLLLPGTGVAGAQAVAERLRAALEAGRMDGLDGRRVTATVGVAEAASREEPAALLARADRALYEGKARGRNQVAIG